MVQVADSNVAAEQHKKNQEFCFHPGEMIIIQKMDKKRFN